MSWDYVLHIAVDSRELGNTLAAAVDPDDGSTTFDLAAVVRKTSDNTIWYQVTSLLRQSGHDIVAAFAAGGYPQVLLDAGMTTQQIDYARAHSVLQYGLRSELDNRRLEFIVDNGFELLPEQE